MQNDLPRLSPHYTVIRFVNDRGPFPEEDIRAESDGGAISALKDAFKKLWPSEGYNLTDVIMMRGANSDTVVYTSSIDELLR